MARPESRFDDATVVGRGDAGKPRFYEKRRLRCNTTTKLRIAARWGPRMSLTLRGHGRLYNARGVELSAKIASLPGRPGVYLFRGADGGVLYVGKARALRDRVRSYFQPGTPHDARRAILVSEIADLDVVVTDTEVEALALENNLIKAHRPPYNVLLRDDKNHPYLKLSLGEEYPRLVVVRRVEDDGSAYGGPYIPASLGRKTASVIHRVFGVRSCKETLNGARSRPCLQHHIGRCIAPCVAEVCALDRYRAACAEARLVLEGRADEVIRSLRAAMDAAAEAERYEEAATIRDQVRTLERLEAPQKITTTDVDERDVVGAHIEGGRASLQVFSIRGGRVVGRDAYLLDRITEPDGFLSAALQQYYGAGRYVPREILVPGEIADRELLEAWLSTRRGGALRIRVPLRGEKVRMLELVMRNARLSFDLEWRRGRGASGEVLRGLQDALGLPVEPRRIEGFDVSNIQGSDVVASMVSFSDAIPRRGGYRKYRIKGLAGAPDDFASIREAVGRRYRRVLEESGDLPDLVLVDGGEGQLGAAAAALDALGLGDQALISLAKREELVFVRGAEGPLRLPRSSPALQLLQRVRDEAHRFAVSFHRKARTARVIQSELDRIPGVGPARRRKLLARFGSVRGVRSASESELQAAVGPATARRIREHFCP
jgi:excinuclease ABC subunit C